MNISFANRENTMTVTQQNVLLKKVQLKFENKFGKELSNTITHFSSIGQRFDLDSSKMVDLFEIHTESTSFWGIITLNENNNGILSTLRFQEIED